MRAHTLATVLLLFLTGCASNSTYHISCFQNGAEIFNETLQRDFFGKYYDRYGYYVIPPTEGCVVKKMEGNKK